MFTGIIEEVGTVRALDGHGDHASLDVTATLVVDDASVGDSIAVNGCCLTVTDLRPDGFSADLMAETMRATALGGLHAGDPVNLERAMAADGRFGGHVVTGHVDAVGTVVERRDDPGTTWLAVRAPGSLASQLVPKGSITVAGASLTVVEVVDEPGSVTFTVGLIPHTLQATTLDILAVGDEVNLEADMLAKYVERLVDVTRLRLGPATPDPRLDRSHLSTSPADKRAAP